MLYKDINKEVARQCCREHTVFNDKKHKESDCEHCPLRRDFKAIDGSIHRGICWFILMNGLTSSITDKSPYAQAEKAILEQEHVSYPLEMIDWINAHRPHEVSYLDPDKFNFESEE